MANLVPTERIERSILLIRGLMTPPEPGKRKIGFLGKRERQNTEGQ